MKSMKKTFALFVLFSMMVTCLSLSSFALEPDTVPSNTAPDADVAMSETDTVADAIEEDAVIMPEHEAMLDDVVSEGASEVEIVDPVDSADTYPACDHNYVTSPVGSPREVYDPMHMNRTISTVALSAANTTIRLKSAIIANIICVNR